MKTILFVEDDADIVEIYRDDLLREGFEVQVSKDGLAAMKSLHQKQFDIVILDLMLPKFNGADVLKFIRTNSAHQHTKVVIFSNAYLTDLAHAAEKLGADISLMKSSCSPAQLINVVKNLLGGGGPAPSPSAPPTT